MLSHDVVDELLDLLEATLARGDAWKDDRFGFVRENNPKVDRAREIVGIFKQTGEVNVTEPE